VSVVYFGEGAASEGDFHAGMNFAATLDCPVVFICRNNGYAISTPTKDQFRGDGITPRGPAYGMRSIRVDGNDIFAVIAATREARAYAAEHSRPVLIETMAYREGHHSTSDDSTRYRGVDEIEHFRSTLNPVIRMRKFLERRGWWDAEKEEEATKAERRAVLKALVTAEAKGSPGLDEIFSDVYAPGRTDGPHPSSEDEHGMPWNLREQMEDLHEHIAKHPEHYRHNGH